MAKGIYVGVNNVARKVKKIYVGAETNVETDSGEVKRGNIFPTSWVGENQTWTSTDGSWEVSSNRSSPQEAFDNSTITYWGTPSSVESWLKIKADKKYKITKFKTYILFNTTYFTNAKIQGSNDDNTWIDLCTISNPQSSLTEIEVTNPNYYSYYRLVPTIKSSTTNYMMVYSLQTSEYMETVYTTKSVARKVKKGYIGVGGIARPFYSSEKELVSYGTATALSQARYNLVATSVGDYALFGGGSNGSSATAVVDTYTSSLVKGTATNLSTARSLLAATSVGDYALFGGGIAGGSTYAASYKNTVDTYTSNLVKGTATSLSQGRRGLAATSVGDYALFGGGDYLWSTTGNTVWDTTVDTYTSSLVKGTATALSKGRHYLAATSVGDYALFAGGRPSASASSDVVDTYTSSLVKGTATALSKARGYLAATTVGDYALFGGGRTGTNSSAYYSADVDTYTSSLVKGTATSFYDDKSDLAATSVGGYAIFAGGETYLANYNTLIEYYSSSLVKGTKSLYLSKGREYLVATSIGDYAIFAGGLADNNGYCSNVDVFQAI